MDSAMHFTKEPSRIPIVRVTILEDRSALEGSSEEMMHQNSNTRRILVR